MPKPTIVIGRKYGTLIITKDLGSKKFNGRFRRLVMAECKNCNSIKSYRLESLSKYKSCGCLTSSFIRKEHQTHGMTGTRIYRIWKGMKKRCNNPNFFEYHLYGGKGIKVCKQWQYFENFYNWAINNGYEENLTLDRFPNKKGDYNPSNCRWATIKTQQNNRIDNLIYTYKGDTLTLAEICEKYNVSYSMVIQRLRRGWSIKKAMEIEKLSIGNPKNSRNGRSEVCHKQIPHQLYPGNYR